MLDLRKVDSDLILLLIEIRANTVEKNGSFWLIHDHDPIELYEFFINLGFLPQTFIFSNDEYRIFLGKI